MRIGTWNLDARCGPGHLALIDDLSCDVWLLTEVPQDFTGPRGVLSRSTAHMSRGQSFAAAWSRVGGSPVRGPSPSSAALEVDGITFWSSVLPWRTCGPDWVWCVGDQAARTVDALRSIEPELDGGTVWGGDWNQSMIGSNYGGTTIGRAAIEQVLARRGLALPTRALLHRQPGMATIDHIAVPDTWTIVSAEHHPVAGRLSDHDAYVVDAVR